MPYLKLKLDKREQKLSRNCVFFKHSKTQSVGNTLNKQRNLLLFLMKCFMEMAKWYRNGTENALSQKVSNPQSLANTGSRRQI